MTISANSSITMMPPVNNISKDIITQNDSDSNLALSLEELGIDEEVFNSLDSDSDGLVTQNEIASAIDSQLSSFDTLPTKEEFESLLSDLGLQMPEPPQKQENSNLSEISNDFASQILSSYDTDGDSLLSSEEVSILSESEFSALDSDGDGSISQTELSDAFEQVASSGETPPAPPAGGGGMPMGGGSSSEDEEEYYSALDTNEDGIVSQEEKDAALGLNQDNTNSISSTNDTLDSLKLLMETIKLNSQNQDEELDLSSFKNILKLINNSSNNSELNTYLSNSNNSSKFNYA